MDLDDLEFRIRRYDLESVRQRAREHYEYTQGLTNAHSGPATFRLSLPSPPSGSIMLSQLSACSAFPVVADTANSTPSEFAAVDKK